MMIRGWQKASGSELTSKYRNKPVVMDGRRYASRAEAARAAELQLMQRAGQIEGLQYQPRYPMVVNGVKICTYIADFLYVPLGDLQADFVVEDVKSPVTANNPVYRLKKRLMLAIYGIDIQEVYA